MQLRVLVIGAAGQLAGDLLPALHAAGHDVTGVSRADCDITHADTIAATLQRARPQLVINTAAYHLVDRCEDEPEQAFAVNAIGVRSLALAAATADAALVHISTDYVFNGRMPGPRRAYCETDAPDPESVYATSKLAGEQFVRHTSPRNCVVRTCGLFGARGVGGRGDNFVETMLRLARDGRALRVVNDQFVSPTATSDLAPALAQLVSVADRPGICHLTSSGHCSWYEFAGAIFELAGIHDADLTPVSSAVYAAKARRPLWSVLGHDAAGAVGIPELPHWRDGLARYLARPRPK
ncbi:MAG: dTDP-4-dehydrorhamnose reductase [Planctomycetota bacterium]